MTRIVFNIAATTHKSTDGTNKVVRLLQEFVQDEN